MFTVCYKRVSLQIHTVAIQCVKDLDSVIGHCQGEHQQTCVIIYEARNMELNYSSFV